MDQYEGYEEKISNFDGKISGKMCVHNANSGIFEKRKNDELPRLYV